jgi:hypothetical protein
VVAQAKGPADEGGDVVCPVIRDAGSRARCAGQRKHGGEDVTCMQRGCGGVEGCGPGFEAGLCGVEG